MQISIPGTDKGNAVLMALVINLIVSIIFMALVPRIGAIKRYAINYKMHVIENIEKENLEVIKKHGLH